MQLSILSVDMMKFPSLSPKSSVLSPKSFLLSPKSLVLNPPKGFTLIELLIVFAIGLLVLSLTGSIASNTYPKSQLRSHASAVAQTLREAQSNTISKKHDSVWGVHLTASDMTLFAGASYATRNTAYDQTHEFPSSISTGGLTDVVFDAFVGTTAQVGTVTLTSSATVETVNVTVNENGNVEW